MDFARYNEGQVPFVQHKWPLRLCCEPSQTLLLLFLQTQPYYLGGYSLAPTHIVVPLCGSRLQASPCLLLSTYKLTCLSFHLRRPVFLSLVPLWPLLGFISSSSLSLSTALSLCLHRSSTIQHLKKNLISDLLQELPMSLCSLLPGGALSAST